MPHCSSGSGSAQAARAASAPTPRGCASGLALAQALLGTAARAAAGRADHRARSGAAPELLRDYRASSRDSGATVLLSSHALAEIEERGRSRCRDESWPQDRGRHARSSFAACAGIGDARTPARAGGRDARIGGACGDCDTACDGGVLEIALPTSASWSSCGQLRALPDWAEDVEVLRPSLDEIYAAFLRREDALLARPHEADPTYRRQGDPRRPAQSLGRRHYAAARAVCAHARIPGLGARPAR